MVAIRDSDSTVAFQSGAFDERPVSIWRVLVLTLVALGLAACSVFLVSAYDKESVDRTTEISKSTLKLYQELLSTAAADRKAAVSGAMRTRHGDVETQMRLHLLKEQARAKNEDSVKVAENLLESWQRFTANHLSSDATALSDATLAVERGILERHLRAAFIAEESKKLGSAGK